MKTVGCYRWQQRQTWRENSATKASSLQLAINVCFIVGPLYNIILIIVSQCTGVLAFNRKREARITPACTRFHVLRVEVCLCHVWASYCWTSQFCKLMVRVETPHSVIWSLVWKAWAAQRQWDCFEKKMNCHTSLENIYLSSTLRANWFVRWRPMGFLMWMLPKQWRNWRRGKEPWKPRLGFIRYKLINYSASPITIKWVMGFGHFHFHSDFDTLLVSLPLPWP